MIKVNCPSCKKRYSLEAEHAGRRVRCPQCDTVFEAKGKPTERFTPRRIREEEEDG